MPYIIVAIILGIIILKRKNEMSPPKESPEEFKETQPSQIFTPVISSQSIPFPASEQVKKAYDAKGLKPEIKFRPAPSYAAVSLSQKDKEHLTVMLWLRENKLLYKSNFLISYYSPLIGLANSYTLQKKNSLTGVSGQSEIEKLVRDFYLAPDINYPEPSIGKLIRLTNRSIKDKKISEIICTQFVNILSSYIEGRYKLVVTPRKLKPVIITDNIGYLRAIIIRNDVCPLYVTKNDLCYIPTCLHARSYEYKFVKKKKETWASKITGLVSKLKDVPVIGGAIEKIAEYTIEPIWDRLPGDAKEYIVYYYAGMLPGLNLPASILIAHKTLSYFVDEKVSAEIIAGTLSIASGIASNLIPVVGTAISPLVATATQMSVELLLTNSSPTYETLKEQLKKSADETTKKEKEKAKEKAIVFIQKEISKGMSETQ